MGLYSLAGDLTSCVLSRNSVGIRPQKHLHTLLVLEAEETRVGKIPIVRHPEPGVLHNASVKLCNIRVVGVEDV
jgi:hypothetical protein